MSQRQFVANLVYAGAKRVGPDRLPHDGTRKLAKRFTARMNRRDARGVIAEVLELEQADHIDEEQAWLDEEYAEAGHKRR
jgi:hypothetical protein